MQADNAQIWYESGQTTVEYEALTDSGDHIIYTGSENLWSMRSGYEPVTRPNGILTGTNIVTPNTTADKLNTDAFTMYGGGALVSVDATTGTPTVTRDATDAYQKHSIVTTEAGVISVISGTAHASAFSTTRGAAGGPPSIPLASIEICQIWLTSTASAVITASEIKQSPEAGYQERSDYPVFTTNPIGLGNQAADADKTYAHVEFAQALPVSHGATATEAATATKKVYCEYNKPIFALIAYSDSFLPAGVSTSVSSKQIYRAALGSSSKSLSGASFNAYLNDGITDPLKTLDGEYLTFKFFPDMNKAPYSITQGYLSVPPAYPVGDEIQAGCTIAAKLKTVGFNS